MEGKGKCPHGEFDLRTGCPKCIAEERAVKEKRVLCTSEEGCQYQKGAYCEGGPPDCAFAERRTASEEVNSPTNIVERIKEAEAAAVGKEVQEALPTCQEMAERLTSVTDKVAAELAAETALALRPGEDVEARGYFEEALEALKHAEARVIASVEDIKVATNDLSLIAKLKKAMENKRKSLLDPLRLQADAIRETYSSLMDPVIRADKVTKEKILGFNKEQERIRLEQEDINRKRLEAAQQEMELKGELSESVNLVEVAPEPAKSISTDMGTTGMTDSWKYEVIDFAQLPDEYKVVDGAMLTAIARKHHDQKQVPGVRFYNEPFITVRAR